MKEEELMYMLKLLDQISPEIYDVSLIITTTVFIVSSHQL